jgi:molybdate transport system regulatory protein
MKESISLVNAFGHQTADKRIEVLRLIDRTGSISQAAREAGISYKAAWQAIDTLSNLTGVTLVEKNVGGVGGGGAALTGAGKRLLEIAALLEAKRKHLLDELGKQDDAPVDGGVPHLGIQTSMRNHLPCRVKSLKLTGPIVRVVLEFRDGSMLVARITRTSAELLALEPGLSVMALCKATAVKIDRKTARSDAANFNLLHGVVNRISKGDMENEVSMVLDSGLQLVGFSPAFLDIRERERVFALVDESTVVVALLP